MTTREEIRLLQSAEVYDAEGDLIGKVGAVYVDADSGEPLWLRLRPGLFRTQPALAPLRGARVTPGRVRLAVDRHRIDQAPAPPGLDQPLSRELVDDLYRHYAMTRAEGGDADGTARSEGGDADGTARSEGSGPPGAGTCRGRPGDRHPAGGAAQDATRRRPRCTGGAG